MAPLSALCSAVERSRISVPEPKVTIDARSEAPSPDTTLRAASTAAAHRGPYPML
jgi:hypothetical protein